MDPRIDLCFRALYMDSDNDVGCLGRNVISKYISHRWHIANGSVLLLSRSPIKFFFIFFRIMFFFVTMFIITFTILCVFYTEE